MVAKLQPAIQFSEGRSFSWSGAKLVNCFAEQAEGDKREGFAVMATPGLTEWADLGAGIRGSRTMGGTLYVVAGGSLYSVSAAGVPAVLGSVSGADFARMADNGSELAFTANGTGYVLSGGTLHTPLSYNVSDVGYVDGYFVWTVQDSDQYFISDLDDGLTYDAADIAVAEGSPDALVGLIIDHRDVLLAGTDTIEIEYNSGNADFPFERQGNAFIERGVLDRDSMVKIDNAVNFVGNDRIVYRLDGYQPVRISTHAIEYQLRNVTYARGFTYTQEGHKFYGLDTDNGTFLFDHATNLWHQRQSWEMAGWRVDGAVSAYGKTLLTSSTTGKIYEASLDVFDEDGDPIVYDIFLPTIEAGRQLASMYSFEVVCETGVGNDDVPDPQIMLRYSDNNGHGWSNEMWRSLGAVGDYRHRAVWGPLGLFRQRQMWLRITDACRKLVISYWADIG